MFFVRLLVLVWVFLGLWLIEPTIIIPLLVVSGLVLMVVDGARAGVKALRREPPRE